MSRESWGSRFGFIAAAVGFSVGLGNIWRFPYLTGQNGGGAFLLVYLVLAVCIGIPLFMAEISLGRKTQRTPIVGMVSLTGRSSSPWNLIGWFGIIATFLVLTYYQLILGWIVVYFGEAVRGGFTGVSTTELAERFDAFRARPLNVLIPTAGVLVLVGAIVSRGLQNGLERAARILIPILFLFLVVLAAVSVQFEGASRGLSWYLSPDFSAITPAMVLAALGQVFYSIGVGMAAAFVYGSYLDPDKSDVPGSARTIVAFDAFAAFLAGLVIFPALFAFGLDPDSGPGLLFVTMSSMFGRAPAGSFLGALFFFLVFVAGLTSVLAVTEALTATAMETFKLSRKRALAWVMTVLFLCGIPIALSSGPWAGITLLGRDLFGFVDWFSGSVLLPIGGFLIALYVAYAWGFDGFRDEVNRGAGRFQVTPAWRPAIVVIIPVAVGLVLLAQLGVLG